MGENRQAPLGSFTRQPKPRLHGGGVEVLRTRHYRRRTEEDCHSSVRRFLFFYNGTHPRELPESAVNRFLTHLAVGQNIAASTQNQLVAAVPFLYGHVRQQHQKDLKSGLVQTRPPDALSRKYSNTDREWNWQWVFPASFHYLGRKTGNRYRHHLQESVIHRVVHQAALQAGLTKPIIAHSFRHSFAIQLLEDGHDSRRVQELLGDEDIKSTMGNPRVPTRTGQRLCSPLDNLPKRCSSERNRVIPTGRPKSPREVNGTRRKSLQK